MIDVNKHKSALVVLRSDLTGRITAIGKDLHHTEEEIEKDFAEQATQLENDEVLNSLNDEARNTVMQIDKALLRIKDGTYGRCNKCSEVINEQRLDIVPYVDLCIECAE